MKLELIIKLSQETLESLVIGGYHLNVFKGVDVTDTESTVWLSTSATELLNTNLINWDSENLEAYISNDVLEDGVTISASSSESVELGERVIITDKSGARGLNVKSDGEEGTVVFANEGTSITTGLSTKVEGPSGTERSNPICAVNVAGNGMVKIAPKEKLLVSFTSDGNVDQSVAVVEIETAAATVEYFEDVVEHTISYDFDTGEWKEDEDDTATPEIGWFKFLKTGVNVLNTVLNG